MRRKIKNSHAKSNSVLKYICCGNSLNTLGRLAPSLLPEIVNVQEESVDSGASAARKPSAGPERSEARGEVDL